MVVKTKETVKKETETVETTFTGVKNKPLEVVKESKGGDSKKVASKVTSKLTDAIKKNNKKAGADLNEIEVVSKDSKPEKTTVKATKTETKKATKAVEKAKEAKPTKTMKDLEILESMDFNDFELEFVSVDKIKRNPTFIPMYHAIYTVLGLDGYSKLSADTKGLINTELLKHEHLQMGNTKDNVFGMALRVDHAHEYNSSNKADIGIYYNKVLFTSIVLAIRAVRGLYLEDNNYLENNK